MDAASLLPGQGRPVNRPLEHIHSVKIARDYQGVFFSLVTLFFGQAKKKVTRLVAKKTNAFE